MSQLPALTTDPKTGLPLRRTATGRMLNESAWRRAHEHQRAQIIAELGWEPEGGTPGEKYVGSTAELYRTLRDRDEAARSAGSLEGT